VTKPDLCNHAPGPDEVQEFFMRAATGAAVESSLYSEMGI
jgi:hypothetical protein